MANPVRRKSLNIGDKKEINRNARISFLDKNYHKAELIKMCKGKISVHSGMSKAEIISRIIKREGW